MSWRLNRRTAGLHPIYLYHLHIDSRWFSHSAEKKNFVKVGSSSLKKRGEQKNTKKTDGSVGSPNGMLLNCKLKQFKHIEWTLINISSSSKDRRLVFRAILGKLEFLVFILPAFFFFGFSGGVSCPSFTARNRGGDWANHTVWAVLLPMVTDALALVRPGRKIAGDQAEWWVVLGRLEAVYESPKATEPQQRVKTTLNVRAFPKIVGFPPKSSILVGVSIKNPSILGYPYFWKHPYRQGPKLMGVISVDPVTFWPPSVLWGNF